MKNAKKRILFIITQAEWGGAQNYVFKAAREAIARGHEVLVTAGGEGTLETRCKETGIPYQKLCKLEREIRPFSDIKALFELTGLLKSWKPDITFLFSGKAGVIGSVASKIAGVQHVVYRIGGWSWLDPVSDRQKWIRIWSERLTAPFKDVIIVQHPGDKIEAEQKSLKPREEIVVVPNGLNLDAFDRVLLPRDQARAKLEELWLVGTTRYGLRTTDASPLIVTIANFYATKDLSNFLHAAQIVRTEYPDTRFMVMGGGGDQRETVYALRKELNLEEVVSFPGAVQNAQTLLSGADLFVSSSAKEGNPWTIHEAMAARIPCIATDVGACAWLLQNEAGWIVPPKNPKALAEKIMYALAHKDEATERSDRARHNSETLFTEKQMWEKTFEILEKRSVQK